jgi:hypothetical protein
VLLTVAMADPISVFATAAGLLGITASASRALRSLYSELAGAPVLILALSNETADISVVLNRVGDARQALDRLDTKQNAAFIAALDSHLAGAKTILGQLEALSNDLLSQKGSIKRIKWCLRKAEATGLKDEIRAIRQRINEVVTAHNV